MLFAPFCLTFRRNHERRTPIKTRFPFRKSRYEDLGALRRAFCDLHRHVGAADRAHVLFADHKE